MWQHLCICLKNIMYRKQKSPSISTWSSLPFVSQCVCIPFCQTTGVDRYTHKLLTCKVTDRQPSTQTNWHSSPLTVLQKSCTYVYSSRGCNISQHTNLYTHAQAVGPLAVLLFLPQFHYGFVVLNASVLGLQVAAYVCIMYNSRIVYCSWSTVNLFIEHNNVCTLGCLVLCYANAYRVIFRYDVTSLLHIFTNLGLVGNVQSRTSCLLALCTFVPLLLNNPSVCCNNNH